MGAQALSSLTNFGVSLGIARAVSATDFGVFAIIFAVYVLLLGVSRGLSSDALGVRFSAVPPDKWRSGVAQAGGTAVTVGLAAGVACLVAGFFVAGNVRAALWALAVTLPGLLLQDLWRFAFFAAGRPQCAAANDGTWVAALVVFFVPLIAFDVAEIHYFVLAWGAAASLAALVGMRQAHVRPSVGGTRRWLRAQRDVFPSFVGEFLVMSGNAQLVTFAIGAIAGLAEAGALRGTIIVFGPINIVLMSATALAVPEGARLRARHPHLLIPAMVVMSSAVVVSASLWGVGAWWLLPDTLGETFLGETWESARNVLPATMTMLIAGGAGVGAVIGLRVLERPQLSLAVRAKFAPFVLLGGSAGAWLDGARGAGYGMAVPTALAAIGWWGAFRGATQAEATGPSWHDGRTRFKRT